MVQPPARIRRDTLRRPLRRRGDERFLHGILGRREVAMSARHRGEHLRREVAQQVLDRQLVWIGVVRRRHASTGGALITCRTSIGMISGAPPGPGADEAFAAISYARSGRSTSTIQYPARNSF